jgi:hypothetical protein
VSGSSNSFQIFIKGHVLRDGVMPLQALILQTERIQNKQNIKINRLKTRLDEYDQINDVNDVRKTFVDGFWCI